MWKPDATLVASPSLTPEEVDAIVDEAHRLGLKVACHTYGGEGMFSCLNAGVDAPNHLLELDEAGVKILPEKRLPFVVTLDDLIALEKGDLDATGGKYSRLRWYKRVLGLEIVPEYEFWAQDPHGPLMISSDGGSTKLALFRGPTDSAEEHPGSGSSPSASMEGGLSRL
jgi:imidazolonepropionase-like amidohydrolase